MTGADDADPSEERGDPAYAPISGYRPSLVLVAGHSIITRVVVGRIVERSALRPVRASPAAALRILARYRPGLVIADGGPSGAECAELIEAVAVLRRAGGSGLPLLIGISSFNTEPRHFDPRGTVNAVVAKPITPEALQPIVEILLEPYRS